MEQKDIVLETIKHFTKNSRSLNSNDRCVYLDEDTGNMCAVGRCMHSEALEKAHAYELRNFETSISCLWMDLHVENFDELLKPEYHGHSIEFWCLLQALHDFHSYWSENSLSENGLRYVKNNFNVTPDDL